MIKNLPPQTNSRFKQGYYQPINENKYKGRDKRIIFRSSWERMFMVYCDANPLITEWVSEPFVIPYYDIITKKQRNYYPDFWIREIGKDGVERDTVIEVKPQKDLTQPNKPKSKNIKTLKNYNRALKTYTINMCKLEAAKKWCSQKNMDFKYVTEHWIQNGIVLIKNSKKK